MCRGRLLLLAIAAVLLAGSGRDTLAQPSTIENRLKAAVVSKFPQFVQWPDAALAGRSTLDLCIAPPDPFGDELDELVSGETLNGRALVVRRVERARDVDGCQVLVLPRRPDGRHPLLATAATRPILTIGDDESFLDAGGIVRLRVVGGRVRFEINAAAARTANLRISSQLLQLALNVRGAGQ
jgi:YfiR/HmsC-like